MIILAIPFQLCLNTTKCNFVSRYNLWCEYQKSLWCTNTFSMEKNKRFIKIQSLLSELKGNYTYNQVCNLMITNLSINLIFKLLSVSETDYVIYVIYFFGENLCKIIT